MRESDGIQVSHSSLITMNYHYKSMFCLVSMFYSIMLLNTALKVMMQT
ncbi:hypothetical protein [Bartonella kosoyi]|nr:hypothetical protein [Bartonella kosoyi]